MSPDELDTAKVRDLLAMGADAEVLVLDVLEACDALRAERDQYLAQLDKATARILTIKTETDIRIASLEADLSAARDGRDGREVYAALKRAEQAEAERDALRNRLAAALAEISPMHVAEDTSDRPGAMQVCAACGVRWPCDWEHVRAALTAELPPAEPPHEFVPNNPGPIAAIGGSCAICGQHAATPQHQRAERPPAAGDD